MTRLGLGGFHTCVELEAGGFRCWGDNFYGQLGLGSTTDQNRPQIVTEF